jgi:hypothetical protein
MARYSATWSAITATAVADTTSFTAGQAPGFLRSASATVLIKVNEIYIGGEDTASTPTQMIFGRVASLSTGALSVGNNQLLDALSTAPGTTASWGSTAATLFPNRSSTGYLLQPSLNTFGGIARWQARYGEEITIIGATQPLGEACLSSKVGTGKTSGHIIYELA